MQIKSIYFAINYSNLRHRAKPDSTQNINHSIKARMLNTFFGQLLQKKINEKSVPQNSEYHVVWETSFKVLL